MLKQVGYEKIIQYGKFIERVQYEVEPVVRFSPRRHRKGNYGPRRRRSYSSRRAQRSFYRLLVANLNSTNCTFGTFTMRDIVSLPSAYKCFRDFNNRLRRRGLDLKYVAVPEFQKRGAVHFHALYFNLDHGYVATERSTRFFASLWSWGFVDLVKTDGSTKLATYLSKYMTKAARDSRLFNSKAYTSSRNLIRPQTITSYKMPVSLHHSLEVLGIEGVDNPLDPILEKEVNSQYLGKGNYKLYEIK